MSVDKTARDPRAIRVPGRSNGERGQVLILMVLAMTLVFLIGVIAVDFGLWFSGRASVLNATDQATMAGSLSLPTDGTAAEAAARQYVQENDSEIASGDITVSFRCIVGDRNSDGLPDQFDIPAICPQLTAGAFTCINKLCYAICTFSSPTAKCNTIVTKASKDVPFGFGPIFGLNSGAAAGFVSAACRGVCGGSPFQPLDLVMIIDRTSSMCEGGDDGGDGGDGGDGDCPGLDNAKAAALSVLQIFDPDLQHVALGVLGPSSTTPTCTGANAPAQGRAASSATVPPATWLPVPLSSNYQNANGSLNTSSLLVKTINCLDSSDVGTNLGDPIKAAKDYLLANGRPGVKWGIILMTDGAANKPAVVAPSSGNTNLRNCGANAAATGGDGDGYERVASGVNPAGACADGGDRAEDVNSGTNATVSCANSGKDRHRFYNYGIDTLIPGTATVTGVEVRLDAWANSTAGTRFMCAELSWDGGATWTAPQQTSNLGISESTHTLGGSSNLWGRPSWSATQLNNTNFRLRVTDVADGSVSTNTGTLYPDGQGTYTAWSGSESDVDEPGNASCSDYVDSNTTGQRESVNIDLSSIPTGATITSVVVNTWDVAASSNGGTYQTFVRLNGTGTPTDSGTNLVTSSTSGCTARSQTIGLAAVKSSGTTMEVGVLKTSANTNRVRVGAIRAVVNYRVDPTFNLDWAAVRVYYTTPGSGGLGPCYYANQQATAAKAVNPPIEIFTIGFGVAGDTCTGEASSSPYRNVRVTQLLADMATQVTLDDGGDGPGGIGPGCDNTTEINSENADGDHFLCEAKSGALEPIFRQAAESLAGGIHLVKIPF